MTNLIATILITTNAHWTVLKTEPSYMNCAVNGCTADHSEKRTEKQVLYRIIQAEVLFEGATNRMVLKSEVLPCEEKLRVLYSGWDYEKPKQQWGGFSTNVWLTNTWLIPGGK
jgi:hypothetical protein